MGVANLNRPKGPQYGGQSNMVDTKSGMAMSKEKHMPNDKFMSGMKGMAGVPKATGTNQKSL